VILRCPICGDDFQPRNYRVKCCSSLCGQKLYYQENRDRIIAKSKEQRGKIRTRDRDKHNDYMKKYMRNYRRRAGVQ